MKLLPIYLLLSLTSPLAFTVNGCSRATRAEPSRGRSTGGAAPGIRFADVAETVGLRFTHTSGRSGRFYLPETAGSGCGFIDYDGDGWQDIFLVNGAPLPGCAVKEPVHPALYRNRRDGTFEDVTRRAGLDRQMYGMGCAVGDYDNDGDADLFVSGLGPDRLYRNNGDGTFTDVTARAGVSDPYFSTCCAWLDYDRDGRLDLFVGSYCKWSPALNKLCKGEFGEYMCPPEHYKGDPPRLYHNRGDGTFEDLTRKAGVYNPIGKNLGILVFDVDDDGWLDFMLANDLEPNLLYRNNHDGTFREIGLEAGVACSTEGKSRAGMGIDSADVANDGREAIVIGNNTGEGLALFQPEASRRETGSAAFSDLSEAAGLYTPSLPFLTFGTVFVDVDNDGLKDLFAANGHVNERVERSHGSSTYRQRPMLFRNVGRGKFHEITAESGAVLQARTVARGVAIADYDRDGDQDLLVSVCNGRPLLLRNELFSADQRPTTNDQRPGLPPRIGASGSERQRWDATNDQGSRRALARAAASDSGGTRPTTDGASSTSHFALRTSHSPHWLAVRLRGVKSNRSGIGTRVVVEAGGVRQQGWVRSGSSYLAAGDLVAWFGLGGATVAERVTLCWPGGDVQTLARVPADREILVREGEGIVAGSGS